MKLTKALIIKAGRKGYCYYLFNNTFFSYSPIAFIFLSLFNLWQFKNIKAQIGMIMLLADKIKQLREEKQLFQRQFCARWVQTKLVWVCRATTKRCKQLAAVLEIDTLMYCNIERGSRPIKRAQVEALSKFLSIDEKELLTLWLADKVLAVLNTEKNIAGEVLKIANEYIKWECR